MIYYLLCNLYIIYVVYRINRSSFHNPLLLTSLARELLQWRQNSDLNPPTDDPHTQQLKVQSSSWKTQPGAIFGGIDPLYTFTKESMSLDKHL